MRWLNDIVMQKCYRFNARRSSFQVNASGVRFGSEHRGPVEHAPVMLLFRSAGVSVLL